MEVCRVLTGVEAVVIRALACGGCTGVLIRFTELYYYFILYFIYLALFIHLLFIDVFVQLIF